jgi:hypothetical protein
MQQQSSYTFKTNSVMVVFGNLGRVPIYLNVSPATSGVPATASAEADGRRLFLRLSRAVPQGAGTENVKIVAIPTVL